jgi:uncharacterized repeat protein (TIGR03803 family)
MSTTAIRAQTLETLYSFSYGSGATPYGVLIADASGALYGTTLAGGAGSGPGSGTVFKLTPPTTAGGTWTESVLYSFTGTTDGANPYYGALIADASGALYGTTVNGGAAGGGTVFKLTPPTTAGGTWTESVLYSFTSTTDGAKPYGGLIADASGALYGTTPNPGSGTVFKLTPPTTAGGTWTARFTVKFSACHEKLGRPLALTPQVLDVPVTGLWNDFDNDKPTITEFIGHCRCIAAQYCAFMAASG